MQLHCRVAVAKSLFALLDNGNKAQRIVAGVQNAMETSVGAVEHIALFDVVFDVIFGVRSSTCSDEVHFRIAYVLVDADRTARFKRDLRNIAADSTKLIPFKQAVALHPSDTAFHLLCVLWCAVVENGHNILLVTLTLLIFIIFR
jgi:hypothetical protein